jgi:hypothetical protein
MSDNCVCVGGVDLDSRTPVRLLDANGYYDSVYTCPYRIREVWDTQYLRYNQRSLPHSEDVCITGKKICGVLKKELSVLDILRKLDFTVYEGDIFHTFEGKLKCTGSGSFYISKDAVPNNSTCFWLCDRPIRRNNCSGRIRYHYDGGTRPLGHNISYIGLDENPAQLIPHGTLIRLSLAYWWSPEDSDMEERCYLQLSGWY